MRTLMASRGLKTEMAEKSFENRIKNVLELIRNQQYEIPYIASYARDIYEAAPNTDALAPQEVGLSVRDLWSLWLFDEKVPLLILPSVSLCLFSIDLLGIK